jgi:hypothetical protein
MIHSEAIERLHVMVKMFKREKATVDHRMGELVTACAGFARMGAQLPELGGQEVADASTELSSAAAALSSAMGSMTDAFEVFLAKVEGR